MNFEEEDASPLGARWMPGAACFRSLHILEVIVAVPMLIYVAIALDYATTFVQQAMLWILLVFQFPRALIVGRGCRGADNENVTFLARRLMWFEFLLVVAFSVSFELPDSSYQGLQAVFCLFGVGVLKFCLICVPTIASADTDTPPRRPLRELSWPVEPWKDAADAVKERLIANLTLQLFLADADKNDERNFGPCVICLEDMLVKQTSIRQFHCRHTFHAHCIEEWIHKDGTGCPMRCATSPDGHRLRDTDLETAMESMLIARESGTVALTVWLGEDDANDGDNPRFAANGPEVRLVLPPMQSTNDANDLRSAANRPDVESEAVMVYL